VDKRAQAVIDISKVPFARRRNGLLWERLRMEAKRFLGNGAGTARGSPAPSAPCLAAAHSLGLLEAASVVSSNGVGWHGGTAVTPLPPADGGDGGGGRR
jgi:hypothetical protein